MAVLYFIIIQIYGIAIFISAIFNRKARKWISGRSGWKNKIKNTLKPGEKRILFHCASLGEFEQGKPVLEALRKEYPEHKIVLTFFSPSGYEVRKNDPLADYVFYLPLDGPIRSKKFVELVNPEMSFFVKYEFWYFYIKNLRNHKIPVYFISAIFRPTQLFFLPLGNFFYRMLRRVSHFFVQNQSSLELLYNHGIPQVSVTGDTRFDRVYQNSLNVKDLPEIKTFKGSDRLVVCGSTWSSDEKKILKLYKTLDKSVKLIIAPHETNSSHINRLKSQYGSDCKTYSQWDKNDNSFRVLIIDHVGILSSIYRYGDAAYIGGGFGKGIHNILEAVVFGIPVFFGPNYKKFREASDLIHWKGAFTFKSSAQLIEKFDEVMNDPARLERIKVVNLRYIEENKGSTDLIIEHLKVNPPE